ncbi:ABC transporter permease [Mangrovibrevibacter kandeliae]|uniref:ABC transporter permease n=1 Tax=Mangrovibrevibacter kandeliae TaxID=2968473 RepID=UPI0021173187|nr:MULTISPECIES: iron ABC transporter permease [unclassified Aurantimonas]MCQ8781889.1 iron ABC transporter permease [Aurantimonas sp. CSK15Z-1]MCW4115453.1 iron ABC transporter permease [Aurantimonas sp. MSK8Z-1]
MTIEQDWSGAADRTAGARPSWLRLDQTRVLAIILAVILGALALPPAVILILRSLSITNPDATIGGWTLTHYVRFFTNPELYRSLLNSLVFAVFSTVVALLFGGTLAWLVERTNTRFKALAYVTTVVSMGTPYILYVSAWLFLLGRSGPLNDAWRTMTGSRQVLFDPYSLVGMILIEGFLWSPLVFLLLSSTFRSANADLEEAARMSGAGVLRTVWSVSIKMATPAIAALALFVFIRAIEAFEVPALVGMPGNIDVLTTDVYRSIKESIPPDLGYASAYSVVLLVAVAVLLHFYGKLSRNAGRFSTVTGKGYRPRQFNLGRWRPVGDALVIFNFLIVLVLPLLALLWLSLLPFMRPMRFEAVAQFSPANFVTVLSSQYYRTLALNTLIVGFVAATAGMILALFTGWLSARRKPGGQIIDQLATMPLVFPGIVMGVAFLMIFLAVPLPIYGTIWALAIAYTVRYLPYGLRYTYAGVLQISNELEEAAGASGATPIQSLRRIIAPLLSPALLSGWLFIFLIATKELAVAVLLAGPSSPVVAVGMYDLWVNGQGGELAAFGLIWAAVMTLVASVFYFAGGRTGRTAAH